MSKGYQFSNDTAFGEDDIEMEFEINPSELNQKYSGYKKQYEEDETDDDYDDDESTIEEMKETIFDGVEEEEDDDIRKENNKDVVLKSILRLIYKAKKNWFKVLLYFTLFISNLFVITYLTGSSGSNDDIITNVKSFGDISKSIQHLQWQINDINNKNKNRLHDFKNYVDLKIEEFSLKFNQIDDELINLKQQNEEIIKKLEGIRFNELDIINHDKVPIILDDSNNVKILPEFATFLQDKIQEIINDKITDKKFQLNYENFIENHVNEIINNKIGFMNKEEILSLITLQFQENKKKLITEIKNLTTKTIKNDVPKKLIDSSIDKNEVGKINYGQAISGARIINYLTSSTFKPRYKNDSILGFFTNLFGKDKEVPKELEQIYNQQSQSPFVVLTSNEGYWKSSVTKGTQLSIKFLEPIYINEFIYIHERLLNGAIMTSAPQHMSLYVTSDDNEDLLKEIGDTDEISGHFKICDFKYELNESMEQKIPIPHFIKRYLIKSIIIVANDNYGNEFFTSFYKFKIHGLTRFDLYSIKKIINNQEINDVIKDKFKTDAVKSFGDDTIINV